MKYSFCSVTYGSCGSWLPSYPLDEAMRRLARIGYDGIEIVCASPHAWPYYLNDERRAQIGRWQKEYGITISSVMAVPGGGPGCNAASACKEEREWTIQYIKDVIDLAALWGCKTLAYVAGWAIFGTRRKDAWNNSLDTLKKIGKHALDRGVTVCIEPTSTDSNVVDSPDDALLMMEESGLPNVAIMFDTAHAFFRDEDPEDYVYTVGKHLKHVHFCDHNRLAPGSGGFDFVPVMQALKDINYAGYVTMEVGFTRSTGADSIARLAIEHLKQIETRLK